MPGRAAPSGAAWRWSEGGGPGGANPFAGAAAVFEKVLVGELIPYIDANFRTLTDQLNRIFQPLKFKARATAQWDHGPFTARLLATHVGGYTNTAITPTAVMFAIFSSNSRCSRRPGRATSPWR